MFSVYQSQTGITRWKLMSFICNKTVADDSKICLLESGLHLKAIS